MAIDTRSLPSLAAIQLPTPTQERPSFFDKPDDSGERHLMEAWLLAKAEELKWRQEVEKTRQLALALELHAKTESSPATSIVRQVLDSYQHPALAEHAGQPSPSLLPSWEGLNWPGAAEAQLVHRQRDSVVKVDEQPRVQQATPSPPALSSPPFFAAQQQRDMQASPFEPAKGMQSPPSQQVESLALTENGKSSKSIWHHTICDKSSMVPLTSKSSSSAMQIIMENPAPAKRVQRPAGGVQRGRPPKRSMKDLDKRRRQEGGTPSTDDSG